MLELTDIPQTAREHLEQIGAADLVIGMIGPSPAEDVTAALAEVRESIGKLYLPTRTVVVHSSPQLAASMDGIQTLPLPPLTRDITADPAHAMHEAYRAVFAVSQSLKARAAVVIASGLHSITPQWIYRLIRPVIELDFDLVTPCYTRQRFEGLLNSGIVAPFTRALYGKRIQHPLGPDFGFSSKLISRLVASEGKKRAGGYPRSIASLTVDAACDGFEICQANVGARKYPRTDWLNQSSVLVQILGPLFAEAEVHAAFWQRIRESEPVPVFGETPAAAEADDTDKPDVQRMIETFRLGHSSLQEIWAEVLGPGTLLEMGKLARLAPEQFRMPDRLWARIVYDFALGHRLRFISQDHLLRAMTPLYLAWVASYAIELSIGVTSIDQRLEQLGLAFEQAKPYALSRWRWPDRFNP